MLGQHNNLTIADKVIRVFLCINVTLIAITGVAIFYAKTKSLDTKKNAQQQTTAQHEQSTSPEPDYEPTLKLVNQFATDWQTLCGHLNYENTKAMESPEAVLAALSEDSNRLDTDIAAMDNEAVLQGSTAIAQAYKDLKTTWANTNVKLQQGIKAAPAALAGYRNYFNVPGVDKTRLAQIKSMKEINLEMAMFCSQVQSSAYDKADSATRTFRDTCGAWSTAQDSIGMVDAAVWISGAANGGDTVLMPIDIENTTTAVDTLTTMLRTLSK
ncbi:hypothetical protein FWF48_00465 [Candidatus Saccharibacteria bacterium]|nr:hypothetical protein [Candidatus Saccharibacteria bacterium]